MKLNIREVMEAGTLDLTDVIPAKDIPLDVMDQPVLTDQIRVQVHAENVDDEILIHAQLMSKIRVRCSRCLEESTSPLSAEFDMEVPSSHIVVDLLEESRQALLLALPAMPLCRSDCKGLCSQCGKNLNRGACGCSGERRENPFDKLKDIYFH
ncbi:MAG: DUF177 domain-containing protein [Elusimicrobia bacterium]|nr:DUF177 domain-containing protein [Elusimicrobiota bacterium]